MKKLFVMLAFLFLSWTGYCVDIQCSNGSDAEIEPRTIYICLVISKMGTEVIATPVSYTHLDVYKRQPSTSRHCCCPIMWKRIRLLPVSRMVS